MGACWKCREATQSMPYAHTINPDDRQSTGKRSFSVTQGTLPSPIRDGEHCHSSLWFTLWPGVCIWVHGHVLFNPAITV